MLADQARFRLWSVRTKGGEQAALIALPPDVDATTAMITASSGLLWDDLS